MATAVPVIATDVGAFSELLTTGENETGIIVAADLAAIVAASDLTNASRAAAATVARNNYPPDSLVAVEPGVYKADATLSPQQRFTAAAAPPNAP